MKEFKGCLSGIITVLVMIFTVEALMDVLHSTTMSDNMLISFTSFLAFVVWTFYKIFRLNIEIEILKENLQYIKDDLEALNKSLIKANIVEENLYEDELDDLNGEDLELHVKNLTIHCDKINYIDEERSPKQVMEEFNKELEDDKKVFNDCSISEALGGGRKPTLYTEKDPEE